MRLNQEKETNGFNLGELLLLLSTLHLLWGARFHKTIINIYLTINAYSVSYGNRVVETL